MSAINREKPNDKAGIGNTFNQGRIRLNNTKGWKIKRRLFNRFFQPAPYSGLLPVYVLIALAVAIAGAI